MNDASYVIYAPLALCDITKPLYPKARYDEVLSCKNETLRQEKYQVWKLLEKAVREYTSLDFDNIKFTKTANGKWVCPDFYFSLSHTDGAICVAVSSRPVGVDIERAVPLRERFADKILTKDERTYYDTLGKEEGGEFLLDAWVKKESLFKLLGEESLLPSLRDTLSSPVTVQRISVKDNEYVLALAGESKKIIVRYTEAI